MSRVGWMKPKPNDLYDYYNNFDYFDHYYYCDYYDYYNYCGYFLCEELQGKADEQGRLIATQP